VHPDDETIGCGGSILKHVDSGDRAFWLNLTGPSLEHPYGFSEEIIEIRARQIREVWAAYKFEDMINLNYPTQMLDSVEPRLLIGAVFQVIQQIQPQIIYITNRSDIHSDHRIGFQAVFSAAKSFRSPFVKSILMYETLSETEFAPALPENMFIPNTYIDISNYIERKINIMRLYDTEIMADPLPRSVHAIKGLAAYRGSRIGVMYAEAFISLFNQG
jgi:LmbE family N-acetylglucosaminyl deacetylase